MRLLNAWGFTGSTIFLLWMLAGDVFLVSAGLVDQGTLARLARTTTAIGIAWWMLLELQRWQARFFCRWQTYLGFLVVIFATSSTYSLGVHASDLLQASPDSLSWISGSVRIIAVIVCKAVMCVYWWRHMGIGAYHRMEAPVPRS